jgi:hypothetical protein
MRWGLLPEIVFKDDLSRCHMGNEAKSVAVVFRFSLNLIRAKTAKGNAGTKRKSASHDAFLLRKIA